MKLALFGATGRTGQHLLEQALAHGHAVTALVRNPSALSPRHELVIVQGDVLNPIQVEATVQGRDVVLSALGGARTVKAAQTSGPRYIRTIGTGHILAAMIKHSVRRFVCQSAYGAGEDKNRNLYAIGAWLMAKEDFEDTERQERLIQQSPLDWVIVRPTRLTDGSARGVYHAGVGLRVGPFAKISRADVADFMLKQVTDTAYVHKTPVLRY